MSCNKTKVAVIGSGVVGLSTALYLKQTLKDKVEVSVISNLPIEQTTSYGCGGLWEPYQINGTKESHINIWGERTFQFYHNLYHSEDAKECGVQLLTAYALNEYSVEDIEKNKSLIPYWSKIVYNFQILDANSLDQRNITLDKYKSAYKFETYVVDQKDFLPYLIRKLTKLGVIFITREITGLKDFDVQAPGKDEIIDDEFFLQQNYDCIINCSGLASYNLIGDKEMYPIRGQVCRIKAPWLKSVWFFGTSYIIPNLGSVVVGGTGQKGDWSQENREDEIEKIISDASELFPSVRKARLIKSWAGLRPGRTPLRLTSGKRTLENQKEFLLIHNYGHGGSGVTIGLGTGIEAIDDHFMPWFTNEQNKKSQGNFTDLSSNIRYIARL